MSPWECPATFSLISYLEHGGGIWHPIGGLHRISREMAKVVEEEGGRIHLATPVAEVLVENGRCAGLKLESGEVVRGDYVIVNADFAHAMTHLVDSRQLSKWTPEALRRKRYSCSTFMLYLGVDRRYDIPHHNILFADDYRSNVDDIAVRHVLSADPSIYIQNASVTDQTLAPEGQSTIYLLVPVTNTTGHVDWDKELPAYREKVLDLAERRGGLTDLRQHIVAEKVMTPALWQKELDVYNGATFNLAHNVSQMLIWRPHNEFEELRDCYLVGGGTHPGSGLPTIYESGRISAALILQREGRKLRDIGPSTGLE
jgi:phytoene desaturase